jgi:hypothetical protein
MGFEVLTAVKMSMLVFWVVKPNGLVGRYQRFGETSCVHLQGRNPEDPHRYSKKNAKAWSGFNWLGIGSNRRLLLTL